MIQNRLSSLIMRSLRNNVQMETIKTCLTLDWAEFLISSILRKKKCICYCSSPSFWSVSLYLKFFVIVLSNESSKNILKSIYFVFHIWRREKYCLVTSTTTEGTNDDFPAKGTEPLAQKFVTVNSVPDVSPLTPIKMSKVKIQTLFLLTDFKICWFKCFSVLYSNSPTFEPRCSQAEQLHLLLTNRLIII